MFGGKAKAKDALLSRYGGSTVTLCEAGKAEAIAAALVKSYEAEFGFAPPCASRTPGSGAPRYGSW